MIENRRTLENDSGKESEECEGCSERRMKKKRGINDSVNQMTKDNVFSVVFYYEMHLFFLSVDDSKRKIFFLTSSYTQAKIKTFTTNNVLSQSNP